MDNNSIKNGIIIFLIVLLTMSIGGSLYFNIKSHLIGVELEEARKESDKVYKEYLLEQERREQLDSLLNSSLSARIHNTYITNIIKNEKSKKDIISMDSASTDSLFAIDFAWAKQRYKYLFN